MALIDTKVMSYMKRLTLILICFTMALGISAQGVLRQQGYVRTVGRPDAPKGKPLSGVLIGVQGQSNNVRSRQNGHFEIPFAQASAGVSSFRLSRVTLGGYNLYETSIMGRPLPVSPSFPLEIVMVSAKEVEAMKQKFTEQVRQRYQAELNKLKAEKAQLGERYQAELNRVNEKYKNCDAYVADLVERFSHIDYATLDYQTSCVYASIEAGNLDEADRLLNQTNSAELLKARAAITKHIEQEQASVRNIDRRLSDYYSGKFEVHAARFDNDSAAWYMQQLVALDTANVKNLMKAAGFYHNSCSKYPESLAFYQRALRQLEAAHEEHSLDAALCYREMSTLFSNMLNRDSDALQSIQKAQQIYREVEGEDTENMARCYQSLSSACERVGDTAKVVDYMQKSIDLRTRLFGSHYWRLGINYSNLGNIYRGRKQFAKSQECFEKGVALVDTTDRNAADALGSLYANWGNMEYNRHNYAEALRLLQKGAYYQSKDMGDGLLFYCMTLHSIGNCYMAMNQKEDGQAYWKRSMDLLTERFGEYGIPLIPYYEERAGLLRAAGEYESALEYYRKVAKIQSDNDMESEQGRAWFAEQTAPCYYNTGYYEQALSAYSTVLDYLRKSNTLTPQTEYQYTMIKSYALFKLGRVHEAMDMAKDAERIREANKLEPGQSLEVMYRCYCALIKTEGDKWRKPFKKFMADKMFTIDIPKSLLDIPGEDTEFVLVSYSVWDWDAERDIYERTDKDLYRYDQKSMTIVLPAHKKTVYMDFDINPRCTINMVTGVNKLARKLMYRTLKESAVKYWPQDFR